MPRMRPRATALRTVAPYNMPGKCMSSTYFALPVIFSRPSLRRTGVPTTCMGTGFSTTVLLMNLTFAEDELRPLFDRLNEAGAAYAKEFPGDSGARQPVHTVYGGAHLFRARTALILGSTPL